MRVMISQPGTVHTQTNTNLVLPWGREQRLSFDIPDMDERRAHLSFFDSPVTASFSFGTATCPYSLARVLSTRYIQR